MKFQKVIPLICIALIALEVIYIAFTYSSLPDNIPIHFSIEGQADGFGRKIVIYLIPVIQIIIFAVLYFTMNRSEHDFNINWPLKEENKPAVQRFAKAWSLLIVLLVNLLLAYIALGTISVAKGSQPALNPVAFFIFMAALLVLVFGGIFMLQEVNAGRKKF